MSSANDFDYLSPGSVYLDTACQSLRPRPVIEALNDYYTSYNSCGERVKHDWGKQVDEKVTASRRRLLDYVGLSSKDYIVSFTLNTTYGLNLLLSQLRPDGIDKIITSDIEHNSVFLSTMSFASRNGVERIVVERGDDGSFPLDLDYTRALVVVNTVSNIDGRELSNIRELIDVVHKSGGIIIIDAAQTLAHAKHLLEKTKADAFCFSAHKAYAPSLGGIVWHRSLRDRCQPSFIGGGMVEDVTVTGYSLATHEPHTLFEAGLQAYGEIIAFGAALDWLGRQDQGVLHEQSQTLFDVLDRLPKVTLINHSVSSTLSFYHKNLDAHLIAEVLSDESIMARSGYFCCHYYLLHEQKLPPLVRLSLGLHTTDADIEKTRHILERILA